MRVGLALGSNLGNRMAHLLWAIDSLRALAEPGESFLVSHFYETEPIDCPPGSPPFINAAIEFAYANSPDALLKVLQAMEIERGRKDSGKNAPRPLDLDILYYGDQIHSTAYLTIPHPRLTERLFVLQPLCDICPNRILPGQEFSISECCSLLKGATSPDSFPSLIRPIYE